MATEELVTEQFQLLGIEVSTDILFKCVSLCEEYHVDAETFCEQWMAFSLNNLNGAPPTLDNLDLMARKEFSKKLSNRATAPTIQPTRAAASSTLAFAAPISTQPDSDLLSNYVTPSSKVIKVEADTNGSSHECPPSPTVSAKYAGRSNPGSVVHSFGDENLLQVISQTNEPNDTLNVVITEVPNEDGELYTKSVFGFELLHEKASIVDSHIQYLSKYIMKKAGLTEQTSVRHKTQTESIVVGCIECDADARLNPKSVVLQGTWEASLSQTVPVDIDNVKQYSLFPGQVVVMKGMNTRGDKFIAYEIFHDASQPPPSHAADPANTLKGTLSLVVASGPFTTSDNLAYEPLKDLITYINTNRPHIVILTGPFMDSEHATVKSNGFAEPYKTYFENLIDNLGKVCLERPNMKIYIVSSSKDAFHVNIYPTPANTSRRKHPNIHFVPDPSTLNIGGFVVSVTSTDVLMHLSQEEISFGCTEDKFSRLSGHIIRQQCLCPLRPAPATLSVDAALWASHAQLTTTPHLLIVPSNFRYFVKEVNGTVVVNPEHLAKGSGGGTFARLLISNDYEDRAAIAAQILRI